MSAGEMCVRHRFSERRGQLRLGPPLLPTSCLKRGCVVWSPRGPFLSFPAQELENRVKGPAGRSGWAGWGPRRAGPPARLCWSRLGTEGPPVTWDGPCWPPRWHPEGGGRESWGSALPWVCLGSPLFLVPSTVAEERREPRKMLEG